MPFLMYCCSGAGYEEGGRQEGRQSRGAQAHASPAGPAHAAHQAQLSTSGVILSVHAGGPHASGQHPMPVATETDASGMCSSSTDTFGQCEHYDCGHVAAGLVDSYQKACKNSQL